MRSWWGSRRTWVRRRPPWMLAMVAAASAAGSASLRSLPRAFMRVRPSRLMPAAPVSATSSAAACRIRSRVARPFAVVGACAIAIHLMVTELDFPVQNNPHNEELKTHLRGALNLGWTEDELREALLQTSAYAGFSAAHEALDVLSEIVAQG